jgi:hypothetical protein
MTSPPLRPQKISRPGDEKLQVRARVEWYLMHGVKFLLRPRSGKRATADILATVEGEARK